MGKVIAIVGMCGSGKSVASDYLVAIGYKKVYFGGVTMEKLQENNVCGTAENQSRRDSYPRRRTQGKL